MLLLVALCAARVLEARVERVHVGQDAAVEDAAHSTVRRDRSRQEQEAPNARVSMLVSDGRHEPTVIDEPVEAKDPIVRNTSHQAARKSLMQVEEHAAAEAKGPIDMILFGCFRKVGRVGTALCACLFGAALAAAMHKACCGEKSCWYTWPCCRRARLAAGVDSAKVTFQMTVHRARDLNTHGSKCSIAVLPRRGHAKKPKLTSSSAMTAATDDLKWEQPLRVVSEQGADTIQLAAFKKQVLGKGTLLGWGELRVKDLLDRPVQKEWVTLRDEGGACIGSVSITCTRARESKPAKRDGTAPKRDQSPTDELTEAEKIAHLTEALSGPLNQANAAGEYKLRYFRIEQKRGVWIWAWYKDKHVTKDTKPAGRIPLVSITNIYEVPNSIAEFFVRYRDATDKVVDMMLERSDRPRELWVKSMHQMIALVREQRRREKAERATDKSHHTHKEKKSLKVPIDPRTARRRDDRDSSETDDEGASVSSWTGSYTSQQSEEPPKNRQQLSVPKPVY